MAADLDPTGRIFTLQGDPFFKPLQILTQAPGAFLVIGLLFGLFNVRKARKLLRKKAGPGRFEPQTAADFAKPQEPSADAKGGV